ncbi:MAG: hypothetical protein A2V86_07490 [Deltaproteobacteria bacterium RBG_16_49_23]|nr:MAG: hypothetical protein A2V86_07490 [Deltaproteobacteria bacterium RBG_16_49_23]
MAIFHDGASSPVYTGQAQTMKIPLPPGQRPYGLAAIPLLQRGINYSSLWQREVACLREAASAKAGEGF